jgi:glycosyltransferase involved in cell wall biosynthesis
MRILINALSSKAGGGITYIRNLYVNLPEVDFVNKYTILLSSMYQVELSKSAPPGISVWSLRLPGSAFLRILWEQLIMPFTRKIKEFDLVYNVAEIAPFTTKIDTVLLVRNPNVFLTKTERGRLGIFARIKWIAQFSLSRKAIKKAKWTIFPSENMRVRVSEAIGLNTKFNSVIHYGTSESFFLRKKSIDETELNEWHETWGDYLLYVSSIAPHKNHLALIQAFDLALKRGYPDLNLVLVGGSYKKKPKLDDETGAVVSIEKLRHEKNITDNVIMTGNLDSSLLPSIYSRAKLFVFPAIRESFGHPLVEAMASGLPVLAADLSYAREICGDAAVYFDPYDPNDIASMICTVLKSTKTRQSLVNRGLKRAECFRWEETFRKTVMVFNTVKELNSR